MAYQTALVMKSASAETKGNLYILIPLCLIAEKGSRIVDQFTTTCAISVYHH